MKRRPRTAAPRKDSGEIVMTNRRNALALLGLTAVGTLGATVLPSAQTPAARPAAPAMPRRERMRRHFPNVPLQTHDGRTVRFYDDLVKGKKVIINFTYSHCTNTCPATSSNLSKVQDLLGDRVGKDVFFISLSLDPDRDTPEVLKEQAKLVKARKGWTFATGRREDIDTIRRELGLYDSPDFRDHMGLLTFGNEPEGKWGATPSLDKPSNILYTVLRRVDPFKYSEWPASSAPAVKGSEQ
jgi:protein SCO1